MSLKRELEKGKYKFKMHIPLKRKQKSFIHNNSGTSGSKIQFLRAGFMDVPHNLSDHSGPLSQTIPIFFACKYFCSFFPT